MGEESRSTKQDGKWTKDLSAGAMQQARDFKKRKEREREARDALAQASSFHGHTFEHLQQTFPNWEYGKCLGCNVLVEDSGLDHACCTCERCKKKGERKVICFNCYQTHNEATRGMSRRCRRKRKYGRH